MNEPMTLADACNVADQFGRMIRGLDRLQEAAAEFRNAEQVIAERREEGDKVAAEIAQLQAARAALEVQIETLQGTVAETERKAQVSAAAILADARAQAEALVREAKAEVQAAREEAGGVIARRDSAVRELKNAHNELAGVTARLEQAKSEGRKIFGG